jgi:hypothetical protein
MMIKTKNIGKYAYYTLIVFCCWIFVDALAGENQTQAVTFNLDTGVKAALDPIVDALKAHWGKGVLISGLASALLGEGDGRQRAMRAGFGAAAGGGVVLGLLAMLGS